MVSGSESPRMRPSLAIIFVIWLFPAAVATAAAPVVDIESRAPAPLPSGAPAQSYPADAPIGSTASQPQPPGMFTQLQQLQDEVRELRGIVEEQANEIRLLKQRQRDDYQSLDGRIGGMRGEAAPAGADRAALEDGSAVTGPEATRSDESGGDVETSPEASATAPTAPQQAARQTAASAADPEYQSYSAAYDLLKNRKIDEAGAKFRAYLAAYPNGNYAANTHYWLGEISLLENQLDVARKEFSVVVEKYPGDRKAEDASFKLGKVYHLLGDNARAKAQLTKVARGDGTAARLAQSYLKENF